MKWVHQRMIATNSNLNGGEYKMANTQRKQSIRKPIAIISGDIHFNLNTMHVANAAVIQAIKLANSLKVPFISNGDMLDQKALMRAEYVNLILETFTMCDIRPYVNVGNHSLINNKGKEHALNFLAPYAHIIDKSQYFESIQSYIIPYHDDTEELRRYLKTIPEGSRLIMHQGLTSSDMGEYVSDHSALNPDDLKDFRVILSHYHSKQDIRCGAIRRNQVGLASYIGSPYSITFAEANDLNKGITILYNDGTIELVPTNLRKHVHIQYSFQDNFSHPFEINTEDLIKLTVRGTIHQINSFNKNQFIEKYNILGSLKIEIDVVKTEDKLNNVTQLSKDELIDALINNDKNLNVDKKVELQSLWRTLICK